MTKIIIRAMKRGVYIERHLGILKLELPSSF